MLFNHLSQAFQAIEAVSSRLEMTRLLAILFEHASPREARIISYLALGQLRPPYQPTQFGLAQKSVTKIVGLVLAIPVKEVEARVHKLGDLGLVLSHSHELLDKTAHKKQELSVEEVYEKLTELEQSSGTGSQEEKVRQLVELLNTVDPLSAQMIVRIILGTLRLGFSDMTLVDALSWMLVGNKSLHSQIEHAYNLCADLGHIAYLLRKEGVKALDHVSVIVGIPIRMAAAERAPTAQALFDKIGPSVAQPKLDGFRLQIHGKKEAHSHKKQLWFFSRNLIDMSAMFPDLVAAFSELSLETFIVEGEAIVFDPVTKRFLSFQETVKRKRKYSIESMASQFPLHLFLFDILYYNNTLLLDKPHYQRRELLIKLFGEPLKRLQITDFPISVIPEKEITSADQLERYFEQEIQLGTEGLVVKRPDAPYQPGKRNFNWIKLKKGHKEATALEDTIDAVILGYNYGHGKRALLGVGAFLAGVYDKAHDRFVTIAKVGTGLSDEGWQELKKKCDEIRSPERPHNVVVSKELEPDVWVYPEIVFALKADEITQSPLHTAGKTETKQGLALRFPRFVSYRPDKSAQEATTVDEIKRMEEDQKH